MSLTELARENDAFISLFWAASKIQEVCPLRLWVVLLEGFLLNTPNPLELGGAIRSAIANLRQRGMTSHNVFLAGHSLGGQYMSDGVPSPFMFMCSKRCWLLIDSVLLSEHLCRLQR